MITREYGSLASDDVFVSLWSQLHGRPCTYAAVYDLVLRLRQRTSTTWSRILHRADSRRRDSRQR